MRTTDTETTERARFASRAVLAFACILVALSCAQAAYRLWLPTEGWDYTTPPNFDGPALIFTRNLLGAPTPLREGDVLRAINGVAYTGDIVGSAIDAQLQPGAVARYMVLREGRQIELTVPLKRWTLASVLAYKFANPVQIISYLSSLFLFGLSIFVLLRRPTEPSARALLLFTSAFLCATVALTPDGATTQYSAVYALAAFLTYLIWAPLLAPSLFVLAMSFPQPKQIVRRAPWLLLLPYFGFWLLLAIFGPHFIGQIGFGLSGVYFVLALIAVAHAAFTQRDTVSRAQLLWGFGGFLALLLCYMPLFARVFLSITGFVGLAAQEQLIALGGITTSLGVPIFQVMIAVAILRYRLFDIDVVIRRTLVYTVLTLALGAVYLLSVVALQALFVWLTGQASTLAVVASTLVIAALFGPLRQRVQALIDRRFFRKKYDARLVLEQFAARAQQEADLDALSADILGVVQATLEPETARLWLVQR